MLPIKKTKFTKKTPIAIFSIGVFNFSIKKLRASEYANKNHVFPAEVELMKSDASLKEKRDRWHESLKKIFM